jgi:hypothetical protein
MIGVKEAAKPGGSCYSASRSCGLLAKAPRVAVDHLLGDAFGFLVIVGRDSNAP